MDKNDEVENQNEERDKTNLTDLAKQEATKVTVSQAIGEMLYPITNEITEITPQGLNFHF